MCRSAVLSLVLSSAVGWPVAAADVTILVRDPDGAAARVAAPASVEVDLVKLLGARSVRSGLRLVELSQSGQEAGRPVPVQFAPAAVQSSDAAGQPCSNGTLWWLMPPGPKGDRRFRLTSGGEADPAELTVSVGRQGVFFDIEQGDSRVLRYNHDTVPVPEGIDLAYARGDYISPLFGPHGEILTDDYPRDHPHHRGVGWSWPVTRFKDEVRDIWAVRGVWARPVAMHCAAGGSVMAVLRAESAWKWGDKQSIALEEVVIRAFRQTNQRRFVDVEVRLKALADGVAIGGRPGAGYGGFGLRAAAARHRVITPHTDPADTTSRRAWLDYSGVFSGASRLSGVAIFEHVANPGYPNKLHQYPDCNYVMPAFPGPREVPLSRDKPLVLKHRLFIHPGGPDEQTLSDVWKAYAEPPKVMLVN